MPVPNTNASHDFIFAKLHGLWANAVKGDALDKLLRSGTPEALQRNLHAFGLDAPTREEFNKELMAREIRFLDRTARLLDEAAAEFYRSLIAKTYYSNLKTILHYRFFPEREADVSWLLIDAPGLPSFNAEQLLEATGTAAFIARLPLSSGMTVEALAEIVLALEKDKDIMVAECALDRICYANVLAHANSVPLDMRATCKELVECEIDITNICMLLRNIKTYKLDGKRLERLWLQGGALLSPEQLSQLATADSVPKVVDLFPKLYGNMLEPLKETALFHSENRLWNHLYSLAAKAFRDFDNEALSIAAFPFLVHFEALNIGRVYEAVHFGIPTRDMQDMMIGA